MEGHSSLASYQHQHHHQQIPQDFQNAPTGNHPYYQQQPQQQHHFGSGSSGGQQQQQQQQMMYANDYDQHNQASTSAGPRPSSQMHQYHHQHSHQYDQQAQHTVRYEQLPHQPHSAPPQQRNFVPQYPVKVVDPSTYGQINRTVNAPPPIVTKPLPPPAPPPSTMTPRKTPPSFLKRQPDAQEQQRLDYEVAKNVSQIMSKNGMKVTQEPILPSPKPLPQLAPISGLQCPSCNRVMANARNLQRHRQTCGNTMISSSPLPHQPHQLTQQNAPQLAAMLQRSPPAPSVSAPPPQHHHHLHQAQSAPSTSSFQHHNSAGNLGMGGLAQQQQNALYSPQQMMNDPNAFFGVGFELKDDPMLFQRPSSSSLWPRDDSFQSDPGSATHDQLDLSDPLGFNDPLHHMDGLETENHKEAPREFQDTEDLTTLDPNPQIHSQFFRGISLDPELEMPMSLEVDEPLTRSDSPSSQGRDTPMFQCDSCKKTVQSERSLRRHYTTCKAHQADVANGEERPPVATKRKGGNGGKRPKKPKYDAYDDDHAARTQPDHPLFPEKNSAILAALRREPAAVVHPINTSYARMMKPYNQQFGSGTDSAPSGEPMSHQPNQSFTNGPPPPQQNSNPPPPVQQYQYAAPLPGGALPSISASWLSNNSNSSQSVTRENSRSSSAMFTPPMASSTPVYKSSPLEELLNEDEPAAEEDGDSRSSNGAASKSSQMFTCEHCSKQLCSMSNLKRHLATCKQAVVNSLSNPSSQPATPAPETTPLTISTAQPLETTAVVTYTKTNVSGGTNTWSNDKGQLVSPKQKIQPSAVVTHADAPPPGTTGTSIKAAMTVGEALRAQHHQKRLDSQGGSTSRLEQQLGGGQSHQRFQLPMNNQLAPMSMSPARIPPRPPNPILNVQQNPPQQQVHQQQIQQMASSRQAPTSQHQITTQQLPQLPNAVLHSQLQLQSPPKKGVIELKHTDLVHITSEPLPAPIQERRSTYQGPPHVVQMQQHLQNGQQAPQEQMKFQGQPQSQNLQDDMDQKRRSSEGQVGQNQVSLPPIQLPQRQPQQQQPAHQTQVAAYQVQFNGRPLPPMQLPPKQQQNVQNNQYQTNHQQHQQHQHQQQQHQQQQHQQQQHQPGQQQHQQQQHQQQQMHQNNPINQQHEQQMSQMQQQQQGQNQMAAKMNQHQMNQQQKQQMDQRNQQMTPQQLQQQRFQQQQQQRPQQQQMSRKTSQPMDSQQPAAKRGRSQSAAQPLMVNPIYQDAYGQVSEEFLNPLDSPLDSIITTIPLTIEVNNHHTVTGVVPEPSGQSSAESASVSMEPSPRVSTGKSHNQAYICPECEKIYSCRKNVKRHRMAVHKMTLAEVLAKPEQPASDEQAAAAFNGGQRRHTVAGIEHDKPTNAAVPKNAGAKRKASTAAMVAKKGKSKETAFERPSEEPVELGSATASKISNDSPPFAQTHMTLANQTRVESPPPEDPIAKVPTPPASAPFVTPASTPASTPAPEQSRAPSGSQPPTPGGSQMQAQDQVLSQHQQISNSQVTHQDKPSAPRPFSSLSRHLAPLHLPPLQDPTVTATVENESPTWAPASAPPTSISGSSTARSTRSTEYRGDEEVRAMAEIAAELKRSAEGYPGTPVEPAAEESGEEELDEDELLIKRLRQGGILEDVGDVSDFLMNGNEADSTIVDEIIDRALGTLPPLSTSSSVGLPSLSSPSDQYLQQQQHQYQQYHQQQMHMWNDGYQQHHEFSQQDGGFNHDQNMMQNHHEPMHYDAHHDGYQHQEQMPQQQSRMMSQSQPQSQLQQQRFQEPQRPVSQPAPSSRRRAPLTTADLTCDDCQKVLGSEYSLRRHRVTCTESPSNRNPNYIRPPQRRASRKAAKLVEIGALEMNPRTIDPQILAERRAAAAEAVVERMEALPPPSVVHDVIDEIHSEKKQDRITSSPLTDEQVARDPVTPMSSSSSSSSSASSTVSTAIGVMPQVLLQRVESR